MFEIYPAIGMSTHALRDITADRFEPLDHLCAEERRGVGLASTRKLIHIEGSFG